MRDSASDTALDDERVRASKRLPGLRDVATPDGLRRAVEELGDSPSACLLCSSPGVEPYFRKKGKRYWKCGGCELVFIHDIYPEFVADFDEQVYHDIVTPRTVKPKHLRECDRVLDTLESVRDTNRLLEVGCGTGFFLERAHSKGWEAVGVEVLARVAGSARERSGVTVVEGELRDAAFPAGTFDVVYMNEVIEHIIEPVDLMLEVRRVLRPGGVALLRTGNARSWAARLRRGRWWYYETSPHGHIRFYGPGAARALAAAAGFADAECDTHGFAFLDGDELRGKWYKPAVKLSQTLLSPLATLCGAGHRLTMRLRSASDGGQ